MRNYTLAIGVVLVLLGLAVLASSAGVVAVIHTSLVTDFFHLLLGVFFLYVGLFERDPVFVRRIVGGMGVLSVSVMGLVIAAPLFFGAAPLGNVLEIVGVLVGGMNILAARYLPDDTPPMA